MSPSPAFAAPAAVSARGFAGTAVPAVRPSCPVDGPVMSLSRRQALGAVLGAAGAALLPAAAFAKGGEGAKISFFGVGGQSSPYTAGIKTGGVVQYKKYSEDEMAYFKSIGMCSVSTIVSSALFCYLANVRALLD